jgi:hypothetical protein
MVTDTTTLVEIPNKQTELEPISAKVTEWKRENRWARYYRERGELASKYVNLILSHDGGYGDYDWIVAMHRKEYEFLKLCYSDLFQLN